MKEYVLSCCSPADLTTEWVARRDISFIPFNINVDGTAYKDDMGETIQPADLFQRMLAGADVKTSQVAVGEYVDYFRGFLKNGRDLLHVTLSSGISGTFNSAVLAADMIKEEFPGRKIYVIDSLCASSGYGLFMDLMADKRDEGMDIDQLYAWGMENRFKLQHWFYTTDLRFFIRGGRISKTAGAIGQVLGICPLLNVDYEGKLVPREKIRTKKRVRKRVLDVIEDHALNGKDYNGKFFISHSDEEEARIVADLIAERFPNLSGKPEIFPIGVTIGCHTGPGTLAIFFWGGDRKLEEEQHKD